MSSYPRFAAFKQTTPVQVRGVACARGIATLLLVGGLASAHAQSAYILTDATTNNLGVINLSTGAVTNIVSTSVTLTGMVQAPNGQYYGIDGNGQVYHVNPNTGATTTVGSGSGLTNLAELGSTTSGVYALAALSSPTQLYSINTSTGQVSTVGSGSGQPASNLYFGLSSGGGTLYSVTDSGGGNSSLYTINTTSGTVGSSKATGVSGLDGMVDISGTLYAANDSTHFIDTINTTTGLASATTASFASYFSSSGAAVTLSLTPIPETQTVWSVALGLAGLGWLACCRRSRHFTRHR